MVVMGLLHKIVENTEKSEYEALLECIEHTGAVASTEESDEQMSDPIRIRGIEPRWFQEGHFTTGRTQMGQITTG